MSVVLLSVLYPSSLFTRRALDLRRYQRVTLRCGGRVTTSIGRARDTLCAVGDCGKGFFPGFATGKVNLCDATSNKFKVRNNGVPIVLCSTTKGLIPANVCARFPNVGLSCGIKAICVNKVQIRRPLCVNNGVQTTCQVSILKGRVTRVGRTLATARIVLGASGTCTLIIGTRRVGGITSGCGTILQRLLSGIRDTCGRNLGPRGSILGIRIGLGRDRLSVHGTRGTLQLTAVGLYRLVKGPLISSVHVSNGCPTIRGKVSIRISSVDTHPRCTVLSGRIRVTKRRIQLGHDRLLPGINVVKSCSCMRNFRLGSRVLVSGNDFSILLGIDVPLFRFNRQDGGIHTTGTGLVRSHLRRRGVGRRVVLRLARTTGGLSRTQLRDRLSSHSLLRTRRGVGIDGDRCRINLRALSSCLRTRTL